MARTFRLKKVTPKGFKVTAKWRRSWGTDFFVHVIGSSEKYLFDYRVRPHNKVFNPYRYLTKRFFRRSEYRRFGKDSGSRYLPFKHMWHQDDEQET